MANQLLATFYVQTPDFLYGNVTVTAQIQYQSGNNWYQNTSELQVAVTPANYTEAETGQERYRYKVDLFRVKQPADEYNEYPTSYFILHKAGTYRRKLVVRFNNTFTLERMIYITIQPDLHVYRKDADGQNIDMVRTNASTVLQNPLHRQLDVQIVNTAEALAARNIHITEPNDYKETVFVKSNLPVDTYCDDITVETNSNYEYDSVNTWLRLKEQIRMTRKVGNNNYQWHDGYGSYPIIQTDAQGNTHTRFISDNNDNYNETALLNSPWLDAIELWLEKPFLDLPLFVQTDFSLQTKGVTRYTGTAEEVETTPSVTLPLTAVLQAVHTVKITPDIVTLNEDNNYTSFIAVEANEGADWTFENVDSRITVTPASGTGRTAVIVRKTDTFDLEDENFINVPLSIISTVDAVEHPNIDGEYEVSDTANVHLEQYTPTHNALIPKMESNTFGDTVINYIPNGTGAIDTTNIWKSFNHSLSESGIAGKLVGNGNLNANALYELEQYPAIEITLDKPHRIRSWSWQSVGQDVYDSMVGRLATVLVLQGHTLDDTWKILDFARAPNETYYDDSGYESSLYALYTNDKCRVDRTVQHAELVDKIRITALAATQTISSNDTGSSSDDGDSHHWDEQLVGFPQIQIFAGVPLLPRMTASSVNNGTISVRSRSTDGGVRVLDRAVSGNTIASVGPADWYLNYGGTTRNRVAQSGTINRVIGGYYLSMCWMALRFPSSRLLGYLYSIDDLSEGIGQHGNTPYAASLYFEGRTVADEEAVTQNSITGGWDEIGIISLDKCFGFNDDPDKTTAWLLANPEILNTWVQDILGLSGQDKDKAYLVNEVGNAWNILRYNASSDAWQNDGSSILPEHDAIHDIDNQTHYADLQQGAALSQLRFTVKSIMNTTRQIPDNALVAMPEMQFFGLPADKINTGDVATITYLKAENENGNLQDILGKHIRLQHQRVETHWNWNISYTTYFRLYIGSIQHIKSNDRRLHLSIQNANGQMISTFANIDNTWQSNPYREISVSGNYAAFPAYYELYINSENNEKIILSSGYTGGTL